MPRDATDPFARKKTAERAHVKNLTMYEGAEREGVGGRVGRKNVQGAGRKELAAAGLVVKKVQGAGGNFWRGRPGGGKKREESGEQGSGGLGRGRVLCGER